MKIIKKLLVVLVIIVAAFLVVVAMRPPTYSVTRSTTITAPPDVVFAQVNDFHKWEAWSPWSKLDPNARNTFEGPSSGKGAVFRWAGNTEVGEGSMTITDSRPNDAIDIKLDFLKPFEDTSKVEFVFRPEGSQTLTTWTMSGQHNFVSKAVCLFMSMDKMLGSKFEEGLASLKAAAESQAKEVESK